MTVGVGVTPEAVGHALHYTIVVGGIAGLVALLAPHRLAARSPGDRVPADEHERRVAELRAALHAPAHSAARSEAHAQPSHPTGHPRPSAEGPGADTRPPLPTGTLLPVAAVSSAAVAGVHAAMGPAHLAEGLLVGTFFLLAALAQLAWAWALLSRPVPHAAWLGGAVLSTACLALWALTRTTGLPVGWPGALPGGAAETLGVWDLAAAAWELVVLACCVLALRRASRPSGGGWPVSPLGRPPRWSTGARAWAVASVVVLALLPVVAGLVGGAA